MTTKEQQEQINQRISQVQKRKALRDTIAERVIQFKKQTEPPKLDSTVKKTTAFSKKAKLITKENVNLLVSEMVKLNLKRYVPEVASSVVEAVAKLRNTADDVLSLLTFCSEFHILYSDFAADLFPKLLKADVATTSAFSLNS